MILDTGATRYMSGLLKLFIKFTKIKNCYIILGDGTSNLHVMGNGTIHVYMDTHIVELHPFRSSRKGIVAINQSSSFR